MNVNELQVFGKDVSEILDYNTTAHMIIRR